MRTFAYTIHHRRTTQDNGRGQRDTNRHPTVNRVGLHQRLIKSNIRAADARDQAGFLRAVRTVRGVSTPAVGGRVSRIVDRNRLTDLESSRAIHRDVSRRARLPDRETLVSRVRALARNGCSRQSRLVRHRTIVA